jgi:undecaprenyl-diphosphatase
MLIQLLAQKLGALPKIIIPEFIDPLLHFSALLAISITFFKDWFFPLKKLLFAFNKVLFGKKLKYSEQKLFKIFLKIVGYIFCADLITALFYFNFKFLSKNCALLQCPALLLFGFCITTLILFSILIKQKYFSAPTQTLNFKKALTLGAVQGMALLPGISRFASTYATARWLNISNRRAFQISFLLHLPLIIAAFTFQGVFHLIKHPELWQFFDKSFFITAGVSTIFAILFLMLAYKLALKNRLWLFGFYMLIPIILLIFCLR